MTVGWLPRSAAELFGEGATAEEAYGLLTVDVPADAWIPALETARSDLGCTYFDWLSAVDEPGSGFRVAAYVVALGGSSPGPAVRGLLVRTTVPHDAATLPTATGVYAGAAWHERETHEMFGIGFTDHPQLAPLLLPDGFEGHPLRKDFVLAARVAKAWPGAKEPGESGTGHGPKRRQMLPPGVPDPNEWGPLKGQLPPAPSRPARATRAGSAGSAAERPARRTRTATAGSPSQPATPTEPTTADAAPATGAAPAERPARRTRSASEGSASRQAAGAEPTTADAAPATGAAPAERPARRTRSAGEGSASQPAAPTEPTTADAAPATGAAPAEPTAAEPTAPAKRPARRTRSSDAPWHHPRPARDEAESEAEAESEPGRAPEGDGAKPDAATPNGPDETPTDDTPGGTA
ncbi:NADH-quinone oxidoreductase subunit C [Streptomyces sp. NPDC005355]|uniref:NADH-quinone oxidoreductase subunit C n=1 Tax=Streptomyces sp. NPDC005355 TaxID=3157038 RepID=UPI0033BADCCE